MGTNYYVVRTRPTIDRPIHIGKSSYGWKFLFQEQEDLWNDPPVSWHSWKDVIKWLTEFTMDNKDYVIIDEYDHTVDLSDFIDLVESKQGERASEYSKCVDGYRFTEGDFL